MPHRRLIRALPCLSLCLLAAVSLAAPAPSLSPEERAGKVLADALQGLGGTERLAPLDSWLVEGRGRENLSAELQGLAPDSPTWRPHEEKLAVLRASGAVAWERRTPRNDQSLRWRRLIYKADATGFVDWTTRRGSMRPSGTPALRRESLMRRVPHLLLLDAGTRATSSRWTGERQLAGAPHDVLEAVLPGEIKLTLLFGRAPAVLRRAEYLVHVPGLGDTTVGWQWNGWKKDARLGLVPTGHTIDVNGTPFQEVEYSRYEAGSAEAAAMMDVPAELRQPMPAAAPGPSPAGSATGEIAPGVHVADIRGFIVMFVEFPDFVVAVEAPEVHPGLEAIPASGPESPGQIAREHLALIERTCPGKPVRYLVLSHHHGDHLGGVRGFAATGATVLAAPGHAATVRKALSAPHTLAPDTWKGEPKIETVADRRVITGGNRRIEVINVGENPHTTENLFVWLPEERLLFQGDLFYYNQGGLFPPSGRGTMNGFFARWLRSRGIEPKAVYGVHNDGAAGPEALARAGLRKGTDRPI